MLDRIARLPVLADPRAVPGLIAAAAAASLVFAYVAEYGFGLEPCILCLYQRVPFFVAGIAGALGLAWPPARVALLWVAAAVLLANSGIAFYHSGVEQHWWASIAGCKGALPDAATTDAFLAELEKPPVKACDEVDWTFLGLSMSNYNVLYSLGLAAVAAAGARWLQVRKTAEGIPA